MFEMRICAESEGNPEPAQLQDKRDGFQEKFIVNI
jgi:hypothetical protein